MAHTKLVHVVEGLPVFSVHIKQVHLAVPIGVLTTDEKNFTVRDGQSAASPQRILHSDGQHLPLVLVNLIHLNSVVDLLLGAAEEATEGVDVLVSN